MLDADPDKWDLSKHEGDARRRLRGAALDDRRLQGAARAERRAGLGHDRDLAGRVGDATSPATCGAPTRTRSSTTSRWQGMPLPFVELRVMAEGNELPWDGESMGELEVRGPWVASAYYDDDGAGRTAGPSDGWFRTGDIVVDASARVHPDQGPLEGRDQVRRRVDLVGRAREQAHGAPGRRRGRGDRDAGREVVGAAARRRRPQGGPEGDGGAAARASLGPVREVVGPRPVRVRGGDPEDRVGKFKKTALRDMFADATAEPAKPPSRPVESRSAPGDRRPGAARARRGRPEPEPADGQVAACACARPGSTSSTCSSGRAATRRCPSCRPCSARRSRARSTAGA